jgi:hypothetical protein
MRFCLGPAIHSTNLIPSSTSLTTASVPLVHAILTRADLPLETIALAVCILDSLNSRFALQWRKGCPLKASYVSTSIWGDDGRIEKQHIDSIHPELIVLSALILSVKFLDDAQQTTKVYAEEWGKGMWTCDQINYTQRCLLENLGYRILPLWAHNIILEALEDMERAGRQANDTNNVLDLNESWETDTSFESFGGSGIVDGKRMSTGKAVMGIGDQFTPVETPTAENSKGTAEVSIETRSAFETGVQGKANSFQLPNRTTVPKEPFPVYVEQLVKGMGSGLGFC